MTAEDLKTQGNKAFSSGNYEEAIKIFSQAIELDPSNHVFYSNRSASHSALKSYASALSDAEKVIQLKPDWARGYSRKGAALHGMARYEEAQAAYKEGLKFDPTSAALQKELENVESLLAQNANDGGMGGMAQQFASLFSTPDLWTKIASNPKLSGYMAEPDFVSKVQEIQATPTKITQYMQDRRIMALALMLMGINADIMTPDEAKNAGATDEEVEIKEAPKQPEPRKQTKPEPEPEPEVEMTEEEKSSKNKRELSDKEKELGNAAYKKKAFDEALKHYGKAWELDETNVAVLTNKSAVLFEMGKYEECIKECEKAVEVGRDLRADFKLIARALGRMGTTYAKLDDIDNAIKYYNKSLSEHRTPDVLNKLKEMEKLKAQREKEAYFNPALSEEAREKGNELFRNGTFSEAIKYYTEAIKRNDKEPRNYSNRAACYIKLMALPEADKDCDKALELDPNFVKAYIRKAAILYTKREFTKAMDMCLQAKSIDTEGKHTAEIDAQQLKCYSALNKVQTGSTEETLKQAMDNPEVREILSDPIMRQILEQMQSDPKAAQDHLRNPQIAAKIRTLMNAGVLRMG